MSDDVRISEDQLRSALAEFYASGGAIPATVERKFWRWSNFAAWHSMMELLGWETLSASDRLYGVTVAGREIGLRQYRAKMLAPKPQIAVRFANWERIEREESAR